MDFNSLEIEASRYEQQLRKHRRALHRIPELGYEEIKTHEYLMRHLEKLAPDDLRVFAQTGIRAVFRGDGTGRVIAFRSDIDALPIQEATGRYKNRFLSSVNEIYRRNAARMRRE